MLFAITLLAAVAVASPTESKEKPMTLPMKHHTYPMKHHTYLTSIKNLRDRGQARIQAFNDRASASKLAERADSGPAVNEASTYVVPVSIGSKTWGLIVDTGTANTWCGARSSCERTSTGRDTGNTVSVDYGRSGSFSGEQYVDQVGFAGLLVQHQSLGVAHQQTGFDNFDGVIGFGPVGLTQGTVSNTNLVPTFMNNLKSQGTIYLEVLGVYFKPESGSSNNDNNGELTLGGVDSSKYSGSIAYYPKLTSGPASAHWGIAAPSLFYDSIILGINAQCIVDTATTLIYIPTGAYNKFLGASKATQDPSTGLASYDIQPTGTFFITFGNANYSLTPSQYLIPKEQYANFGIAPTNKFYSWINDGGSSADINCIISQKFLENYYSVFDTRNSRIGFATRT